MASWKVHFMSHFTFKIISVLICNLYSSILCSMCVCFCVCTRMHALMHTLMHAQLCPDLYNPLDCSPAWLLYPWNFPSENNEMGYHFLFYIQFTIVIFCEFTVSVDLIKKIFLHRCSIHKDLSSKENPYFQSSKNKKKINEDNRKSWLENFIDALYIYTYTPMIANSILLV